MLENIKKFKEFKIICYLSIWQIISLFPELKVGLKEMTTHTHIGAIAPTSHELDRQKREREEKEREWRFILQYIAEGRCHINAQLSIEKEFLLHPIPLSNLLGVVCCHGLPKYCHNQTVAVFNCQIYDNQSYEYENEGCGEHPLTGVVKDIARDLSEVLKCNTKLLFDGVEYSFVYEKKE